MTIIVNLIRVGTMATTTAPLLQDEIAHPLPQRCPITTGNAPEVAAAVMLSVSELVPGDDDPVEVAAWRIDHRRATWRAVDGRLPPREAAEGMAA